MSPRPKIDPRVRVAMGRRFGASPAARERMRKHDAEQEWRGVCRRCGKEWRGKLADRHVCEEGADGPAA